MKILGVDTSTKFLSIALTENDRLIDRYSQENAQMHSVHLVPMIKALLEKNNLKLDDVDLYSISIGPGSFTGLRVGVSVIKALATVVKRPITAVPALDIIAKNIKNYNGKICVIIDAKKQQLYSCLYEIKNDNIKKRSKYDLKKIEDLLGKLKGEILFIGDGIELYRQEIEKNNKIRPLFAKEHDWRPNPYWACVLGRKLYEQKKAVSAQDLAPMYIYARTCTITKPKKAK